MPRPDWDAYFVALMDQVSTRATCDRGRSGCVIVRDRRIISTGYVGSPPGLPHCDDVGHDLKTVVDAQGQSHKHCMRTIHAEQNAICQAARYGMALEGTTLYCRMVPCRVCAMLIISVGISRVVARRRYHADQDSVEMFRLAEIRLDILEEKVEPYDAQQHEQP